MTLAAGTKLGSYEVVAPIGAGGMGEVYQAHDTKLGRDVAIKVLPEAFAHDADRLSRFQREAKMLAALNHPNIATIFGLEHSNSTHYLVMELVAGETLADRIKQDKAVPVEEALGIAKQIAEALEAAHEKGIIHRDLKPANVKVTPEGKVKVLDFGLAKAFAGDSTTEDIGNSPTLSMAATMQGVILGTAAYMSPEQARGKTVDKRTDIWAFGCVLYEMLTGKQAFHGEDVTDILAAVIRAEPDWSKLPENTPQSIRTLLRRCLQKDKSLRVRDAGDVRIEIHEALTAPMPIGPIIAKVPRRTVRQWVLVSGLACLVAATITGLAVWNLKRSQSAPPAPVSRSVFSLPPSERFPGLDQPVLALSPDGKQLAYIAGKGGAHQQLYLRSLDSFEAKTVPGTDGATSPFFSPDGQWVAFFADGKLKKVSLSGGATVTLCDAPFPRGASWGSSDTIIFAPTYVGGLSAVPATGGKPQPLTTPDSKKGDVSHRWPEFLPGANAVLFNPSPPVNFPTMTAASLALYVLKTGEQRDLKELGTNPRYASTGHLLYVQGGNLMAVPFDAARLEIGPPLPIVEGIAQSATSGAAQFSISDNGTLVYIPGGIPVAQRGMVWVDRKGAEQPIPAPARPYRMPRISPDGKRVAAGIEELGTQVWIYDLGREALTRFTFEGSLNTNPVWTPDGKRVVFESGAPASMFWQPADGSGKREQLANTQYGQVPNSLSPDGQVLAFAESNPATGRDLWVMRLSDRKPQPFLQTPFNENAARFSPDGRWLAYMSDESGRLEIYVQPFPGPGGKWQISTDGGTEPVWNPNGRELFYRGGDKMMAVDVTSQPSFLAGKPRMLFEGPYLLSPGTIPNYDVSLDGQRFLMLKAIDQEQTVSQINIVQNWFEELKRRMPSGK